jgi:hypothetical protein
MSLTRRWFAPKLGMAAALVITAAALSGAVLSNNQAQQAADRPECPHDPRELIDKHAEPPGQPWPGPGDIIDIPEFHDCQRFIQGDPRTGTAKYLDLYAIYASHDLAEFQQSNTFARLAATIYSYAKDSIYRPLHIEPGYNCLYLKGSQTGWTAFVVPHRNSQCALRLGTDPQNKHDLSVVAPALDAKKYKADDIPPVARWDWDLQANEQYIGIRCGELWCNIGRKEGFTLTPALIPPPEANTPLKSRVYEIKGWYDQQFLAEPGPNGPKPTGIMGTVVPSPFLDSYPGTGTWDAYHVVAHVYVTGDYPKLHLKTISTNAPLALANKIIIKRSAMARAYDRLSRLVSAFNDDPRTWDGKLERSHVVLQDGDRVPAKVIRRGPWAYFNNRARIEVPGTARWRWSDEDEKVWTECEQFCCETCKEGTPGC